MGGTAAVGTILCHYPRRENHRTKPGKVDAGIDIYILLAKKLGSPRHSFPGSTYKIGSCPYYSPLPTEIQPIPWLITHHSPRPNPVRRVPMYLLRRMFRRSVVIPSRTVSRWHLAGDLVCWAVELAHRTGAVDLLRGVHLQHGGAGSTAP